MWNIAKNYSIGIEIFDDNESQIGDIKKDEKEKDKKNIDVSIPDSYSYAITMICIC